MNTLHFSENIARLRHKKKITQEQLADFVGVTKASVSKWETKQSMPDVLLLPRLAAFFDVTIDELLGYEPQLAKEQIQKLYLELAREFAEEPFEKVIGKSQGLVRQYYSCYRFLFHVCCLWLNHYMLAEKPSRQIEILQETSALCTHILSDCKDVGICSDTVFINAIVKLQLGRAGEVIEDLEELLNPCRLSQQGDNVLIQAYQSVGEEEKADSFTQISMYVHLLSLISSATQHLAIHSRELDICEETIQRVEQVAAAYQMEQLQPNTMAQFRYQAAVVYCINARKEEAFAMLRGFVSLVDSILEGVNITLHGDKYFDKLDMWFDNLDLGGYAPRDRRVVLDGALQALKHPVFQIYEADDEFQKIQKILFEREEKE